jgi:hypothetical protein
MGVRARFERPVGGAAEREKGRERVGGPVVGVLCGAGGVIGPGSDQRAVPGSGPKQRGGCGHVGACGPAREGTEVGHRDE